MSKRLVRFDWALKKLLRNKANFEILEGFISELLGRNIVIKTILESESNKHTKTDKQNRVDLLTELDSGELVLIELQVESQYDYFHRMVYGASKLITDYMDAGFDYDKVRRVLSVNIVYFDLGHGIDYVYKGVTEFRGIHENDLLNLSASQKKEFYNLGRVSEIFPEYYILKINGFNDVANNTLDEWIYFLKNSDIKSDFKAKGLDKASEVLDIMKLSDEDRVEYEGYIENRRVAESSIKTSWLEGKIEGELKGKIEGKIEGKVEVALRLIDKGMSVEEAAEVAGMSVEELKSRV